MFINFYILNINYRSIKIIYLNGVWYIGVDNGRIWVDSGPKLLPSLSCRVKNKVESAYKMKIGFHGSEIAV
jgi:hypothetical protein